MSRYPFTTAANEYLEIRKNFFAESTYRERKRKLRYIGHRLEDLHRKGSLSCMDPGRWNEKDVRAIVGMLRDLGISTNTKRKYLGFLNQLCLRKGNNVFGMMKDRGEQFPRASFPNIKALSSEDLRALNEAVSNIYGWEGEVCRLIVSLLPNCGLRPGELRMARLKDLNLKKRRLFVDNPKGADSWGQKREVVILEPAIPYVVRFLEARRKKLDDHGVKEALPLIPCFNNGEMTCYSESGFRRFVKIIKAEMGSEAPEFSLKTFRATYCTALINKDPSLLTSVSRLMGHSNTNTTQRYYAQFGTERAIEDVLKKSPNPYSDVYEPKIEKNIEVTG